MREIRRYRENVFWNPVDPSLDGFLNQAGHLNGIANIKSPIRLSVTPFVTGYINTDGFPNANIATTATPAYTGGSMKIVNFSKKEQSYSIREISSTHVE